MLFAPALFSGGTLWVWDASLNFLPNYLYQAQQFQAGHLPQWTTRILGGFPYAADPVQGLFFPLKAIFFFPADPGWLANAFVALVYLVSGLGMLRLARSMGLGEAAATLTALAWIGSGTVASESFLTNWIVARTFVPWMLTEFVLLANTNLRENRWPLVRAVFFGSMALLAGEPQTFMIQFVLGFFILAFGPAEAAATVEKGGEKPDSGKRFVRAVAVTGIVSVAALIVSAVQWYPALDLAAQTPRGAAGISLDGAHECTTHPVRYFEMLFPLFYGSPSEPGTLWPNDLFCHPNTKNFYIPSFYQGPVVLLLVLFVIFAPGRDRRLRSRLWPWVISAVLFFVLSLGERGYLFDLAWKYVPYWNHFRWPERFVPWLTLAVAVLAGFGLDEALKDSRKKSAAILLVSGSAAILALTFATDFWIRLGSRYSPVSQAVLAATVGESLGAGREFALLAGVSGLALWFMKSRKAAAVTVVLLAGTVLYLNAGRLVSFVDGSLTVRSEPAASRLIRTLVRRDAVPVRVEVLPVYAGVPPAADRPREFGTTFMWQLLFGDAPLVTDLDAVQGYNSLLTDRWIDTVLGNPRPLNVIRLFAVDAVVAAPYDHNLGFYGEDGYPLDAGFLVVPVKDPVPRVVCPQRWKMASADAIRKSVHESDLDPRAELLIEQVKGQEDLTDGERTAPASRCRVVSYEPERVILEIDQIDAAPVALLDSYFSGWTVRVNGRKTPIYPAWGIHRAVAAPAGRSTVEFIYRTPGLAAAGGVSAGAALCILCTGLISLRHRRASGPPES